MTILRPDPTFYPSPRSAMQAPKERLAYAAVLNPNGNGRPDALAVMDVDPDSSTYNQVVGRVELNVGDEVHHFGWNACSSALCPYAPHPHVERRYLLVPGLKSSRIYVIDTKPDPMAGPLGEHVGRMVGEEMKADGVRMRGGRRVAGLNRARRGWTLILDDGEEITSCSWAPVPASVAVTTCP